MSFNIVILQLGFTLESPGKLETKTKSYCLAPSFRASDLIVWNTTWASGIFKNLSKILMCSQIKDSSLRLRMSCFLFLILVS